MKICLVFLFSVPFLLTAQTEDNIFFCGYSNNTMEHHLCNHFKNNFKSNIDAENAVKAILSPLGLPANFILVPCDSISNAVAVTPKDGLRYILYDPIFLDKIKRETTDWSSLSILAHEIGHHLSGHTTSGAETLADQREMELEADEFSGFVMAKLGATLEESKSAINLLSNNGDDKWSTHPSKDKRLASILKGYNSGTPLNGSKTYSHDNPFSLSESYDHFTHMQSGVIDVNTGERGFLKPIALDTCMIKFNKTQIYRYFISASDVDLNSLDLKINYGFANGKVNVSDDSKCVLYNYHKSKEELVSFLKYEYNGDIIINELIIRGSGIILSRLYSTKNLTTSDNAIKMFNYWVSMTKNIPKNGIKIEYDHNKKTYSKFPFTTVGKVIINKAGTISYDLVDPIALSKCRIVVSDSLRLTSQEIEFLSDGTKYENNYGYLENSDKIWRSPNGLYTIREYINDDSYVFLFKYETIDDVVISYYIPDEKNNNITLLMYSSSNNSDVESAKKFFLTWLNYEKTRM